MKKKIAGLALTAVVALGGMSAFAAGGTNAQSGAQNGNLDRARTTSEECVNEECTGENKAERIQSVAEGLKSAGKSEIASKLENGEFQNMREGIESLTEEENLEVRTVMREKNLNGNGNKSGKGMAKRDGSLGLCSQ